VPLSYFPLRGTKTWGIIADGLTVWFMQDTKCGKQKALDFLNRLTNKHTKWALLF
jgi:hypothetical protein